MRYINLPVLQKDKIRYLATINLNIPLEKFSYRSIKYNNERLDALADKFYGDGSLWYIIAMVNKIQNPLKFENSYLIIPSNPNDIIDFLTNNNKK